MYGNEQYGNNLYGQSVIQDIIDDAIKPDLLKYIISCLWNTEQFQAWNNVGGNELLKYNLNDVLNQLFIDTATWGLSFWEQQYGILTNINKFYEDRRELVKAKIRGTGTTTIQMIKNTAEAFSNGECDVIEHSETYLFTVKFIGIKGIPHNMQSFENILKIIKLAHLNYDFQYNCIVWSFLPHTLTRGQAKNQYTWDSIKSYE